MAYFVDAHIHMFNLLDIPLYETLDGKVKMNTTKKLAAAFSSTPLLLGGILSNKVHVYKDFIQFFERPQKENIKCFAHEVAKYKPTDNIILTPLVMDFDCVRHECSQKHKPCIDMDCPLNKAPDPTITQDPNAEKQYLRLQKNITELENENALPTNVKIFPFIGFDLRKLTVKKSTALADLKKFWSEIGLKKLNRADDPVNIKNGTAIGLKLYPPIGFNPYPEDKEALNLYVELYEWCIAEQIPLTVHCQPGSYSTGRIQREVNRDTKAENWLRLFEAWEDKKFETKEDIKELRINFAHFGGEACLEGMLDSWRFDGIDEKTWTYRLIELIGNYPHAYADISAYDFSDKQAAGNLATLISKAHAGKLHGHKYKLADKLLWGSDVPMVLDSDAYRKDTKQDGLGAYEHLMQNFRNTIYQAEMNTEDKELLIANMSDRTPMNFLFK